MTPPYSVLYNVMTPPSSVFTNGLKRPYSVSYPLLFFFVFSCSVTISKLKLSLHLTPDHGANRSTKWLETIVEDVYKRNEAAQSGDADVICSVAKGIHRFVKGDPGNGDLGIGLACMALPQRAYGGTNMAEETNHVKKSIVGAIVDFSSRIGREEKVAMELAIDDFYFNTNISLILEVSDSGGDPIQAAHAGIYIM
ncbi:hypothetical protein TEA_016302 [Camellia sinensis var. sinensis]|uniref:Receptor ligand binding region domain-containing protein n=1 Tax=Camellia sinensis var. sinensis TaxID=542762 RepID=A0A4S4EF96_CAMSN|nr:hypothetical protein TEA_016302 [Camellia sinensis var. sinensis]